jgi:hypothetical protein
MKLPNPAPSPARRADTPLMMQAFQPLPASPPFVPPSAARPRPLSRMPRHSPQRTAALPVRPSPGCTLRPAQHGTARHSRRHLGRHAALRCSAPRAGGTGPGSIHTRGSSSVPYRPETGPGRFAVRRPWKSGRVSSRHAAGVLQERPSLTWAWLDMLTHPAPAGLLLLIAAADCCR